DQLRPAAALDLSDGLATDLPRLTGGRMGAEIDLNCIPCSDDLRHAATFLDVDPRELVAAGGEDYTLCVVLPTAFIVDARQLVEPWGYQLQIIGEVVDQPGVRFFDGTTQIDIGVSSF